MSGLNEALTGLVMKRLEDRNSEVKELKQAIVTEVNVDNIDHASTVKANLDATLERKLEALKKRGINPGDSEWTDAKNSHKRWEDVLLKKLEAA